MVTKKININKLTIERILKDYYVNIVYKKDSKKELRTFSTWELNNDNCLSDFGYNYYCRTNKSCSKEYKNHEKTLGREYTEIKRTVKRLLGFEVVGIELTNKKKKYDTKYFMDSILILK